MLIVKKPKAILTTIIFVVIITALISGCTDVGTKTDPEIGIVMDGIDVSEPVLTEAKKYVASQFDMHCKDFPNYEYLNWRIEELEWVYTYDVSEDIKLDVYQINFEFLSQSPEKVVLAGGMYITNDNWVCPTYPNCTYLIFDANDNTFLCAMMENDCFPGEDTFTADMYDKLPGYARTTAKNIDTDELSVSDLSASTNVGVGVFLDYADDKIVVLHGFFGLFIYDLNQQKMVLSIDLEKAVGTNTIQGSQGAAVTVSKDGSVIQLYFYPESGKPLEAYYINTSDLSCKYDKYRDLGSYFRTNDNGRVEFSDGTLGEIVFGGSKGTISELIYRRGDKKYQLFPVN